MKKHIILHVLGIAFLLAVAAVPKGTAISEAESSTTLTPSIVKDTLTYPQRAWIGALEYCESRGNPDVTIIDSNGYYSYGILQFQLGTFLAYGKKYGMLATTTTEEQARALVHDPDLQEKIAAAMAADGLTNN